MPTLPTVVSDSVAAEAIANQPAGVRTMTIMAMPTVVPRILKPGTH